MKRHILFPVLVALVSCSPIPENDCNKIPETFPDYVGVTIPSGIAPLDFCVNDQKIKVTVSNGSGMELSSKGKRTTDFPIRKWHKLLAASEGDSISFSVCAKTESGWVRYKPFIVHVSADAIDYGLVYRRIYPGYEAFGPMGIYARDLSDFSEKRLVDNTQFFGCVNCHSFNNCSPEDFSLHIRGSHGGTLIRKDGKTEIYNTKTEKTGGFCVYPYWHPSGNYIAYSSNTTRQAFHVCPEKLVEVFDLDSDVQVYDTQSGKLILSDATRQKDMWETFPAFSADGKKLYFTAAQPKPIPDSLTAIRYNLYSVDFDDKTGMCGTADSLSGYGIDTLVFAASEGKSVALPRPSHDGRFLMYTLSDYGTFPIWHHEADLWLMDLETGESHSLDNANSPDTESYHSWDSSSRWFVFSSRRIDGLHTRLYLCHIDENGNESKPFLLPQRNPKKFYSELFYSYNIPEFTTGPVHFSTLKALRLINKEEREQFSE